MAEGMNRIDILKPEEGTAEGMAEVTMAADKLPHNAIVGWITAMDLALLVAALAAVQARGRDTIGCSPIPTSEDMEMETET
jgi:hypothetical protein